MLAAGTARAWTAAVDIDGDPVQFAQVCELTGSLPSGALADYPPGMWVIARPERPQPGAQLDLVGFPQ